ncbi:MAG: diguanylate cyclase [Campylobacterota bacterium]|nr:diguanylate cyclase [Campylobacterota bacterium]
MSKVKDITKYSQNLKVLFVEDEENARRASIGLLTNFFDSIDVAVDGEDGLQKYQNFYEEHDNYYDLVITDINMPKMSGRDMIQNIRTINKNQPIIVISAYHKSNDLIDLIQLGITDFILKPMRSAQLIQVLYDICKTIFLEKAQAIKDAEIIILKERMELALKANNDGVWDWDITHNNIYLSSRIKEILGAEDNENFTSVPFKWLHSIFYEDYKRTKQKLQEHIDGKSDYYEDSYRLKHSDGSYRWVLSRGKIYINQHDNTKRMIGTLTDITEKKNITLKMAHQSQIIEQIHDSVISTDLDGIIKSFNHGSEILLGYTSEEIIGQHITILYLSEDYDKLDENIKTLMREDACHTDIRLIKKNKEVIEANLSLSLLLDESNKSMGIISYSEDITQRKKAEEILYQEHQEFYYKAYHDELTGLPNRTLFNDKLEQGINRAKRNQNILALLFIDIDNFKQINDSLGHDIGDKVLQSFATLLKGSLRYGDTISRLGGDEFTVILEDISNIDTVLELVKKIMTIINSSFTIEEHNLNITSSIGVSIYPNDSKNAEELLNYADTAMYQAKTDGRNTFNFYQSIHNQGVSSA